MLVFYGDHLPYLGDNQKGYAELGSEVTAAENDRTDILCSYKTPYVIWANSAGGGETGLGQRCGFSGAAGGRGHLRRLPWQYPAGSHRPHRGRSVVQTFWVPCGGQRRWCRKKPTFWQDGTVLPQRILTSRPTRRQRTEESP